MNAIPYIKEIGSEIAVICPLCNDEVYRREPGPYAEASCSIAFGLHAATCKKNPSYKESEMDKFIRDVLGQNTEK